MAKNSQELAAVAAEITTEGMGEKVRVHALAKALGITSADLIQILVGQGIDGKRATSTLPRVQVDEILTSLRGPVEEPVETTGDAAASEVAETPKKAAVRAPKKTQKKAPAKQSTKTPEKPAKAPAKATKKAKKKAPEKSEAVSPAPAVASTSASTSASAPTQDAPVPSTADEPEKPRETAAAPSARRSRRGRKTAAAQEPVKETVDELIDRIVESVDPTSSADSSAPATPVEPAESELPATGAATQEAPRKVRRRIVRRVGSRTAASDAELLRKRKAEQSSTVDNRQAVSSEGAAANTASTANADGSADNGQAEQAEDRSRRRGRRGRNRGRGERGDTSPVVTEVSELSEAAEVPVAPVDPAVTEAVGQPQPGSKGHGVSGDVLPVLTDNADIIDEPVKLKGSTRLESKRRWRQEQGHDKRKVVSKAEFLARRENVDRAMIVRDSQRSDHPGTTTQVGITEDGMLVEHFVTSETQSSIIGNIYLGRVQNVLSSMEAAFIDIGTGRNAVLYSGEVDWRSPHLHNGRSRRIESALRPGDQILVQAIKDPLGHKGARLTNRLSFAGRYLVYVPGGKTQGISRKLPEAERKRLKEILLRVVPEDGGTIIRTAAEGVSEELIAEDVDRLHQRWLDICSREEEARARKGSHPVTMYEEPNMLVKVIRDIFNEDFDELVVDGGKSWSVVRDYVHRMAPDLEPRVVRYRPEQHGGADVFADRQLDEQLAKALSRKVWLPSGGYLIIDPTEAMTVIDVNTGSFVGSGGNLEETVTRNNLEAAEEIVRQMRLRDLGGMIVVDFIDMVLPENRDLVLRRLSEFLGRDRTRHKVSEVTSLGLVQITRKRLGTGLLETFSTVCPTCEGRGVIIHADPVEHEEEPDNHSERRDHGNREERRQAREQQDTRLRHEKAREQDAGHGHARDDKAHDHKAEARPEPRPAASDTRDEPQHEQSASGARRGRRRVVRRVEQSSADVSEIAAQAVAHAGVEDPDEPSGADYVPDHVLEQAPDRAPDDVVAAPRSVATVDRRGRRQVRRVLTPENPPQRKQERQEKPEPPSEDRSFVEAKAEFDASPRRRRRTRGRSRSDVEPKASDFGGQRAAGRQRGSVTESESATAPEAPASRTTGRVDRADRRERADDGGQSGQSGRRGRRRVVRSAR